MDAYEHPRRGGLVEAGDEFLAAPALQAFLEHACSVGRAVSRSPSKTRPLRGDAFGYHVPGVDREVRRWIASGGMLHHDRPDRDLAVLRFHLGHAGPRR